MIARDKGREREREEREGGSEKGRERGARKGDTLHGIHFVQQNDGQPGSARRRPPSLLAAPRGATSRRREVAREHLSEHILFRIAQGEQA